MLLGNSAQTLAIKVLSTLILTISFSQKCAAVEVDCKSTKSQGEAIQCLQNKINQLSNKRIPRNSVVAFAQVDCPDGWKVYSPAYGRFVRGIDISGTTDPDRTRAPGNLQEDIFQNHNHTIDGAKTAAHQPQVGPPHGYQSGALGNYINSTGEVSSGRVGVETRPKNVALLYCIKE